MSYEGKGGGGWQAQYHGEVIQITYGRFVVSWLGVKERVLRRVMRW